ncbi:site-specific integrase [Flagellimonas sp. HMM57]|uniref:site-specific integrase n=1 Tax=unclassified Flagellimonas TaxID=2644544 RepID=UPI0013CFB36A|nr:MULTISPECIES: site-specific integrase [unclassified Flagellimonas]UII76259.1 site-specific integrase [Flagellimonas sp. HMM57]
MKSKSTFTIIFFTRKSRSNPKQLSIYVRITVEGKRAEISLKRNVHVIQWDSTKTKGKGNTEKIRILNAYLNQVYTKLLQCHKELLGEDKIISSDAIKTRYLGEDDNSKTLRELISYHNGNMVRVLKAGTMKNYYTTEKYLHRFLDKKRKVKDMYLKQVNYRFVTDFEHYLRDYKDSKKELSMGNNGVMKHLERFKKMINLAIKLEWMHKNPFDRFQLKYDKYDRAFLTERELELLENTDFKSERLQRIKDCFVFSCYTGLSYVDVKELTEDNIVKGIDNNNWIYTKREKTDELVKIPILPKAWRVLQKYRRAREMRFVANILPISSNQKTNSYLKEIAKSCGIHKKISFHVARHTFATTVMLSNGVPIETVSKLLGHNKLSTTQIYARVVESKISEDINNLLERFKEKRDRKTVSNC